MRKNLLSLILSIAALSSANAATNITYSASASPDANPDGNSGSVNVWTTSNTGVSGFFLGNSANNAGGSAAGAGTSAWAVYAQSLSNAFATHTFSGGALAVGQTVSLDFDNGWLVDFAVVGIKLRNGSTDLMTFSFTGGQSNYARTDAGGTASTTEGFTGNGGTFSFTLNSATSYSSSFRSASWSGSISNLAVDNIQVFNIGAGTGANHDVFFNNLTVVPEPSSAALGLIGTLALLRRRR